MKGLASIIIFVFFIPYTASVFMGLSYLFESIFNIPYESALYLMGGLSAIYLVLGGYLAMAIIDFFQGLIMINFELNFTLNPRFFYNIQTES